jgi:hypothetical protein
LVAGFRDRLEALEARDAMGVCGQTPDEPVAAREAPSIENAA